MTQIDLTATSNPAAPTIDKSNDYDSVHVPAGVNRSGPAVNPAGVVAGVVPLQVTIGTLKFANPA